MVTSTATRNARTVDPLLSKIEALTEPGCYSLTFTTGTGEDRAVVLRLRPGEDEVPGANLFPGWSPRAFAAAVAAVRALHEAREIVGPRRPRLRDIEGGWDVGLGNVLLSADGVPSCVAHGGLESNDPGIYRCAVCGAAAGYDE